MGAAGDFGRRYVLDPIMLPRALGRSPRTALDVGCGEGRFCRMLRSRGVDATGLDPTPALIDAARRRDAGGKYVQAGAEGLPFSNDRFELLVSYLALIDIADLAGAINEMVRVLQPGGGLLIANLNSFNTAGVAPGWVHGSAGERLHFPIDHYLVERPVRVAYRGIRVLNYHRPLSTYMQLLLSAGLRLRYFDEPSPSQHAPAGKARSYRRVPWFCVMEWEKPG